MTEIGDKMINNLAKLSSENEGIFKVEKRLAREHQKLTETSAPEIHQEIRDRKRNLKRKLSDI